MSSSHGSGNTNGSAPKSFSLSATSNGNTKKTAFGFGSSRNRPTESPAHKNRSLPRRPHQLGHGDDSSDEEERAPVHEEVSGFDTHTGGALAADGQTVSDKDKPLVIPVTSKNNWRDRPGVNVRKGKKNLLPREVQAMQEAEKNGQAPGGAAVETEGPSMAYGLSFARGSAEEIEGETVGTEQPKQDEKPLPSENKPLTDDQIAMQALLRETTGEVERRSDLVIEASRPRDEDDTPQYDEGSSFRTDVASRPEPATLDQYNAIPVEEFGAALLRGMGWKDGQAIGRGNYSSSTAAERALKPRVPERRPGFLGIGAKDTSGGKGAEAELGAWGKSAMRKASRKQGEESPSGGNTEGVYMPVMMRNKQTGEYITEEELAAMKKASKAEPEKDEWRERRDRNLEKSGRDRDRDREYRKRDYDDERSGRSSGSSRRDRSRSKTIGRTVTANVIEIVDGIVMMIESLDETGTGSVNEIETVGIEMIVIAAHGTHLIHLDTTETEIETLAEADVINSHNQQGWRVCIKMTKMCEGGAT
ncbi:hypothetical protein N7492_005072 [Penicillium capsulatum]|uniref:Pre-mRNA-splicing factor n=1 Tax=Penicillium capsulatum TaxID=69766 RepID=A0A9W9LQM5_9EURO|nr:hypothetical protein N7492_005072 [Penicillium capsulatum]KAJ6135820.1 hypothetical protein N7512_000980 [Penicillium capsulatum]